MIDEIDKYLEVSELNTFKTREDTIAELLKRVEELEKQASGRGTGEAGSGGSGTGKGGKELLEEASEIA